MYVPALELPRPPGRFRTDLLSLLPPLAFRSFPSRLSFSPFPSHRLPMASTTPSPLRNRRTTAADASRRTRRVATRSSASSLLRIPSLTTSPLESCSSQWTVTRTVLLTSTYASPIFRGTSDVLTFLLCSSLPLSYALQTCPHSRLYRSRSIHLASSSLKLPVTKSSSTKSSLATPNTSTTTPSSPSRYVPSSARFLRHFYS
jgi:hypothetical protein